MKKTTLLLLFSLAFFAQPVFAALNVFSCEPEWKSLVGELGHGRVSAYSATTAYQDPHHIEARPSLIAKVRHADLVICTGADLEIGWLPLLLRQAGNDRVQKNQLGYFAASDFVKKLEIPASVDRSMGDVHASGNPHIHLDPRNITIIANALTQRLIAIDPQGTKQYQQYLATFLKRWQAAIVQWKKQAKVLSGVGMVSHHKDWVYLFNWLNIKLVGTLEPKPGLPTTVSHLVRLKSKLKMIPAKFILYSSYQNPRAAKRFSQLSRLPVVQLPFTVGGADKVDNLFGLFNVIIQRLTGSK